MFRLPFSFIFTGIAGFILFHLLSLGSLAGWIGELPRSPDGWFRVHLFILGWATMTAMGAVYQLISVVLQTKIYSDRLGLVHYIFFLVGLAGLLVGFRSGHVQWIAGFAVIAFIGILMFVWNIFRTLIRSKHWNTVTINVAFAMVYLTFTGLLGMAMGLNFVYSGLNEWHERLFAAHIWLGTIGWFGALIIGFSFKLLPMFYLSHGYSVRLQYVVSWLWNIGVIVGAACFLAGGATLWKGIGFLVVTAAAIAYNLHIPQIRKHRHKKTPGEGIRWATISAIWMALLGVAVCILFLISPQTVFQQKTIVLIGWGYLWGWVALTILGYLSKIVPFLWWTHHYGPHVGKMKVPSMAQLINDRYVQIGLTAISISLLVLMAGVGFDQILAIRLGGSALSLFTLAYTALIIRVVTR